MTTRAGIVYARVRGYRPLELDLHLPESGCAASDLRLPARRRVADRNPRRRPRPPGPDSGRLLRRMADHGLAVASVDYRLAGEARFPAQRDDVAAACAFLHANRDELGLGDGPLVIWGVSAGGQLAALQALDPGEAPAVTRAVLWYAVTDLPGLPDDTDAAGGTGDRGSTSREALLLGSPAAAVPRLAADASPVGHAHPGAPPFLLLHGTKDVDVPLAQSERLAAALTAVGVPVTVETVDGEGHLFRTLAPDAVEGLIDRSVRFLLEGR